MRAQDMEYIRSRKNNKMHTYEHAFPFEISYLIISLLISIFIFYYRLKFRSDKPRTILFFFSIFLLSFHLIVAKFGISSVLKTFGSSRIFTFDESFLRNMAIIFFLLTWVLTLNLFRNK